MHTVVKAAAGVTQLRTLLPLVSFTPFSMSRNRHLYVLCCHWQCHRLDALASMPLCVSHQGHNT